MNGPQPRRRPPRPWLGLLVVVAAVLPSPAWADRDRPAPPSDEQSPGPGSASEHFSRGVSFYKSGSLDAALAEFNRAYELRPDHRVLFNIGQVHSEKQDWVSALRAFRLYLVEGGDEVPPDRAAAVRELIKDAQGRVSSVTISANVARAEILVDGVVAGAVPSSTPVLVNAGIREIVVRAEAHRAQSRRVTLAGGEEKTLSFVLEPLLAGTASEDASSPDGPRAPRRRGLSTGAWLAFGGAAVLAGGAVTTAFLTRQAQLDFSDQLEQVPGDRARIDDERARLRLWAGVTDGLAIAAVACAGVGLYLALTPARTDKSPERAPGGHSQPPRQPPLASVDAIFTGTGIVVRGAF